MLLCVILVTIICQQVEAKTTIYDNDDSFWPRQGPRLREQHHRELQLHGATLFQPIGYTASSFNYAHLHFKIDLKHVEGQFGLIRQLMNDLKRRTTIMTTRKSGVKYEHTLRIMEEEANFVEREWNNTRLLFSPGRDIPNSTVGTDSHNSRTKRFAFTLGLVATTLFGLFSGIEISRLIYGNDNRHMVEDIGNNRDAILRFDKNLRRLNQTVEDIINHSNDLSKQLGFEMYKSHVESIIRLETNQVNKIVAGLELLLEHKLSPQLIYVDILELALDKMMAKVTKNGFDLAIGRITDLFQCQTSFQMEQEEQTIMHVYVHIPMFRPTSVLKIFRYIETPQMTNDSVHAFSLSTTKDVIAVNQEESLYYATSLQEINQCDKLHQWIFCETTKVMEMQFDTSCISALFAGLAVDGNKLCVFNQLPARPTITAIGRSRFVVYHPIEQHITTTCGKDVLQNHFKGIKEITLEAGCCAISESQQLVHDQSLRITFEVRTKPLNITAIQDADFITYLSRSPATETKMRIDPLQTRKNFMSRLPALILSPITLGLFGIGLLFFLKWRIQRNRTKKQRQANCGGNGMRADDIEMSVVRRSTEEARRFLVDRPSAMQQPSLRDMTNNRTTTRRTAAGLTGGAPVVPASHAGEERPPAVATVTLDRLLFLQRQHERRIQADGGIVRR